uniref:Clone 939 transcribed RNA sequence n=1 Tax=Plectreurys tristis TaxID=33319 RepID=A0A0C4W9T3_PLETR|nr:venom peptide U8-PLTX-Pt1b [Plectreurys tristis]
MKFAVAICILSLFLVSCRSQSCGWRTCSTDQCCVRIPWRSRCLPRGGLGEICGSPPYNCPCQDGYDCVPMLFNLGTCRIRSTTASPNVTTIQTAVPTGMTSTQATPETASPTTMTPT